jgi:hypothetical protein
MRGREASHASTSSGCHERVLNASAFGFGNPKSSMALASALRSTSKSCLIAQIDGALSRCVFDNYIDRSLIVHLTKSGPEIMVNHARRWMTLVHAFGSQIANTWSPTCRGRGAIHRDSRADRRLGASLFVCAVTATSATILGMRSAESPVRIVRRRSGENARGCCGDDLSRSLIRLQMRPD